MKNRGWLPLAVAACLVIACAVLVTYHSATFMQAGMPPGGTGHAVFVPAVADWQLISNSTTPPPESACFAAGVRCFTPQAMNAAYNYGPLFAQGFNGKGKTIAVIDSFGSPTIASDLHVFDTAFGLQPMCGEAGVTCTPDMPTFGFWKCRAHRRPCLHRPITVRAKRITSPGQSRSRSMLSGRTPLHPKRTLCW